MFYLFLAIFNLLVTAYLLRTHYRNKLSVEMARYLVFKASEYWQNYTKNTSDRDKYSHKKWKRIADSFMERTNE